ncbi:MAG: cache domain-containing protein, partial [candidate division NC10 bacterium]|nr:cache domain-containing protein [candidate division NC10 bacterium]
METKANDAIGAGSHALPPEEIDPLIATRIPFRWLGVILLLAVLTVLGGGIWFYQYQERRMEQEIAQQLRALGELKVEQITCWRAERLGDAGLLCEDPFLIAEIARWARSPQAAASRNLLRFLRSLQRHYHYRDILLVDSQGRVGLSLSGQRGPLDREGRQALATAFRQGRAVLTDLHLAPDGRTPHLAAIAPLRQEGGEGRMVGALVLQCDGRQFLYPLIQSWPTASRTAETLPVRKDGDSLLFLNDLRHLPDTALRLRLPLSRQELPAVQAVLGREGIVRGRDYRGGEALAFLKAVPDSPWFMVAK